jgi:hypothetical protein
MKQPFFVAQIVPNILSNADTFTELVGSIDIPSSLHIGGVGFESRPRHQLS